MIIGVPKEIKEMEIKSLLKREPELEAVLPMRLTVMPAQPLPTMLERYGVLKWFIR